MEHAEKGAHRLGREEWVEAARRMLAEGGVEAVRVEVLARTLRVTKGSFYWHFADRGDLLRALLAHWETERTEDVIEEAKKSGSNPAGQLLALFEASAYADDRLEGAIRSWATGDAAAAAAVERVDRRRLEHLIGLFEELGFQKEDARRRAYLGYLARLGSLVSGTEMRQEERVEMARLHQRLLTK
jgi:AcrR family transcriptional regulator